MPRIFVVGTADTKGEELAFLAARIRALGAEPTIVDVGTRAPSIAPDIAIADAALRAPTDRGTAVVAMGEAFARVLSTRSDFDAILGIGGGGGTSIITAGMRALPIGLPKLMVSTLAAGDVSAFVGVSDIVMMPSVTDLAGLNRISRVVLANAAAAIVGMSHRMPVAADTKPAIGLTMFGVTTPCVTAVAEALRPAADPVIFHATGTGGRSMEALVESGLITGVIDVTTTEVCDLLFGGVLPAGPDRFGAIARTGVPCVLSLGACDMVNFWAPETVPERYRGRNFYRHNANITLMRTTTDECAQIGTWIGTRLNACTGPLRVLIPERGVSALDIVDGPFFDPVADEALFQSLERTLVPTANRRIERLPLHINDPQFAAALVAAWRDIAP